MGLVSPINPDIPLTYCGHVRVKPTNVKDGAVPTCDPNVVIMCNIYAKCLPVTTELHLPCPNLHRRITIVKVIVNIVTMVTMVTMVTIFTIFSIVTLGTIGT